MSRTKKQVVLGICIVVLIIFICYLYINYKVDVKIGYELVAENPPVISMMIFDGATDEEILSRIGKNPSLIKEQCESCLPLGMRYPLLSAVSSRREDLVKYLILNGAPVESTLSLLKEEGPQSLYIYLEDILNELEKEPSGNPVVNPAGGT